MVFSFGQDVSEDRKLKSIFGISFGLKLVAERGSTVLWFGVFFSLKCCKSSSKDLTMEGDFEGKESVHDCETLLDKLRSQKRVCKMQLTKLYSRF